MSINEMISDSFVVGVIVAVAEVSVDNDGGGIRMDDKATEDVFVNKVHALIQLVGTSAYNAFVVNRDDEASSSSNNGILIDIVIGANVLGAANMA
jgi:hypothetical protein